MSLKSSITSNMVRSERISVFTYHIETNNNWILRQKSINMFNTCKKTIYSMLIKLTKLLIILRKSLLLIGFIFLSSLTNGQKYIPDIIPASTESQAFAKYGSYPVKNCERSLQSKMD